MNWEHFRNAPVSEAILDIRVKLPASVTLEELAAVQVGIKDRFPNRQDRLSWEGVVSLGPDAKVAMQQKSSGPDGYQFHSADGRRTLQVRFDGMTFILLRPYGSWVDFRDEAHDLWDLYSKSLKPEAITRLALRYINRIEIPSTVSDFKEYFRTTPEIAQGLPQGLAGFLMRLLVPMEPYKCMAIITETILPVDGRFLPFILDIDVFDENPLSSGTPAIWEVMDRLRDCKNDIFFESITEATKELFR